jgi:hypothetical protein
MRSDDKITVTIVLDVSRKELRDLRLAVGTGDIFITSLITSICESDAIAQAKNFCALPGLFEANQCASPISESLSEVF